MIDAEGYDECGGTYDDDGVTFHYIPGEIEEPEREDEVEYNEGSVVIVEPEVFRTFEDCYKWRLVSEYN